MYIISEREDGTWQVKKEKSKRAKKLCSSKIEAINYCQEKGYEFKVEVNIGETKVKVGGKKYIVIGIILILLILIFVALLFLNYKKIIHLDFLDKISEQIFNREEQDDNKEKPNNMTGITYEDFQVHFLELGNESTGDSVYIKAGETDILIDAGSERNSASHIADYLEQYVTDNKLEYVIATHGDSDHISGFVGNKSGNSYTGILYNYEVDNFIMNELTNKTTNIYEDFLTAISYIEDNGANIMYAADCFNNENGAKSTFILDETNNITMDILYNKYYFEESEDENNYSVCTMFNYNEHHYMLTGDLELEGEEALADYYDGSTLEKTLPHVDLFKAGHHGSKTSSNLCLLEKITPDIVCVCCCAGNEEYTDNYQNDFPTQEFINRVAKYTDQIYVTTMYDKEKEEAVSFNGTIIVSCNGSETAISASNNLTKLKDSDWFNQEIYVKDGKYADSSIPGAIKVPQRVWPSA